MIEGVTCPTCGSDNVYFKLIFTSCVSGDHFDRDKYQCVECKNIFPVKKKEGIEIKEEDYIKVKAKRYFVSYNYNDKQSFGFGNSIIACNYLNIRETEKYIKTKHKFSSAVVLYYREMKEDEK